MSITQIHVDVDTDTFAIENIFVTHDNNGTPETVKLPNYTPPGADSAVENLYDHSDNLFLAAITAVIEDNALLGYRLDGNPLKMVSLQQIENSFELQCIFSRLLLHDPIYCEVKRVREEEALERPAHYVYCKYVQNEDAVREYDMEVTGESRHALLGALETAEGLTLNEADAYINFLASNPSYEGRPILQKYCVKAYFDDAETDTMNAWKARVLLLPSGTLLPEFQICLPVVQKR